SLKSAACGVDVARNDSGGAGPVGHGRSGRDLWHGVTRAKHGHGARAAHEWSFCRSTAMTVRRTVRKGGFTLVEILIVVIIVGILPAIVIPQFTSASQDVRKNSRVSQLQTLRSQIELYKLQHL